jgi:hypothetical protein
MFVKPKASITIQPIDRVTQSQPTGRYSPTGSYVAGSREIIVETRKIEVEIELQRDLDPKHSDVEAMRALVRRVAITLGAVEIDDNVQLEPIYDPDAEPIYDHPDMPYRPLKVIGHDKVGAIAKGEVRGAPPALQRLITARRALVEAGYEVRDGYFEVECERCGSIGYADLPGEVPRGWVRESRLCTRCVEGDDSAA